MTTQRILLLSYLVLGVLVCAVLGHLISASLGSVSALSFLTHSTFGMNVFSTDEFWSMFIGTVIGAGIGVFCWVDERVKVPATQVVEELQRVTWPTVLETRAAAFAVIIASIICAVLLGIFDLGWQQITSHIYTTP